MKKKNIWACICAFMALVLLFQSCSSSKTRKGEIYCGDISDSDSLSFIKWNEYFDAANNIHNGKIDKKADLEGSEREITIEGKKGSTPIFVDNGF